MVKPLRDVQLARGPEAERKAIEKVWSTKQLNSHTVEDLKSVDM